jgi:hypothetical protein
MFVGNWRGGIGAVLFLAALAACGGGDPQPQTPDTWRKRVQLVTLPDGREVVCDAEATPDAAGCGASADPAQPQ